MSLIVTIRTPEGAIMAADSRTTWSSNLSADRTMVGIHFSDTANKLFLAGGRFGISTCGDASIGGRSISAWMEDFIQMSIRDEESVREVVDALGSYFVKLRPMKDVIFHVVGYESVGSNNTVLSFYRVSVCANGELQVQGPGRGCGASWDGEITTMSRLIKDCFIADATEIHHVQNLVVNQQDNNGKLTQMNFGDVVALPKNVLHFPEASIKWRMFTLQEAIDFAVYAIRTTIATLRFQSQPVTVGEPIDLLVIKPSQAMWLSKKDLHMS